jgi:EmrB/QacA subfamily drug resistance transporter
MEASERYTGRAADPRGRSTGTYTGTPSGSGVTATGGDKRWLLLGVIALAQLMIVLDATIMNIALPSAQKDLGFSVVDRQWVVTAYALAFGSLLLFGGKLGDLVGRKVTFVTGLIGFAAASAVGGAAVSFPMLITARAVQGGFAAVLAPSALSLLATTFTDPRDHGRAFGVYGAVAGAGGAVGLLLGGLLTGYLSWRWCLYVNVFFALIAAAGALMLLGPQRSWGRPRLDVLGALLVSGGMFCLVYGFSNAASDSWGSPLTWGVLIGAAALVTGFAVRQTRAPEPLLPPSIVADRNRGGAYIAMLVSGAGMFGIMLFLNFYMQQNLAFSPITTGLAFLPMVVLTMSLNNIASIMLMPRTGPRPLIGLGMLLCAAGAFWLTRIGLHTNYATGILPALLLVGAGLGLIFAPVTQTGTAGISPRDTGVASATINASNQLGGSIGTSLLNTIFASTIVSAIAAHTSHGAAALDGYTTVFWWTAAIFAGGAVIATALLRSGPLATAQQGWGGASSTGEPAGVDASAWGEQQLPVS